MKTLFASFLSMPRRVKALLFEFDDTNGLLSAATKEAECEENEPLPPVINNLLLSFAEEKSIHLSKRSQGMVVVPERLLNATLIGISREGSLKSAKRLAWSMLFNVKNGYTAENDLSSVTLKGSDSIIITGGYDDSPNNKLERMIKSLSNNPQFTDKSISTLIFAGSRLSLDSAKLKLAPYVSHFEVCDNVLEKDSFLLEETSISQANFINALNETEAVPAFSFSTALQKISELFCAKHKEEALSVLFTPTYSVLNRCKRTAMLITSRNYALPRETEDLTPELFSSVCSELFTEASDIFDETFQRNKVLQIEEEIKIHFFHPNTIVGISLTPDITLEKFVNLLIDPTKTKGTINFMFDETGFLLAAAAMFLNMRQKLESAVSNLPDAEEIVSGWIIIPDGKFEKDKIALIISKIASDKKDKDELLAWGKLYFFDIEPYLTLEIYAKSNVFFADGSKKATIAAGKGKKKLIVDLRKREIL